MTIWSLALLLIKTFLIFWRLALVLHQFSHRFFLFSERHHTSNFIVDVFTWLWILLLRLSVSLRFWLFVLVRKFVLVYLLVPSVRGELFWALASVGKVFVRSWIGIRAWIGFISCLRIIVWWTLKFELCAALFRWFWLSRTLILLGINVFKVANPWSLVHFGTWRESKLKSRAAVVRSLHVFIFMLAGTLHHVVKTFLRNDVLSLSSLLVFILQIVLLWLFWIHFKTLILALDLMILLSFLVKWLQLWARFFNVFEL